jgi:hypothetical protein
MSFDLIQVQKLRTAGGLVWQRYQELLSQADQSAHGSPAQQEFGEFCQAWIANPNELAERVREEIAARSG